MLVEEQMKMYNKDTEIFIYFDKNATYIPSLLEFPRLKFLDISFNKLKSLPDIPDTVNDLSFQSNLLPYFPKVPPNLLYLNVRDNKITYIYANMLPKTLIYFNCSHNLLVSLPDLSEYSGLKELNCDNNLLNDLPKLPSNLEILCCQNNKLSKLLELPNSLIMFNSHYNDISCQQSFTKAEFWKLN